MGDRNEILVTSDISGWCTMCIWDSHTGAALMNYKGGGTAGSHCVSFVGTDYVLCAEKTKPLLHLWPVNSQERSRSMERIVVPGCVSALCVSPNGDYCIFAEGQKLHIWDLVGGQLLSVRNRHFRPVTCVKFTDDGSYFISCGEDGLVIVWPLAHLVACHASELLSQKEVGRPEPKFTFVDHSLPITDLYVGHGGIQALITTVSGDQTCKIYSLSDGCLLLSVVFNCALSAVTMSVNELEVFVGTVKGDIYQFDMQRMPRTLDYHVTKEEMSKKFVGHSKPITCLSTSLDGFHLVSGSADGRVIIWDIKSTQCMKVLQHKGPISNAFFASCPKQIFSRIFKPSSVITNFKKTAGEEELVRFIRKESFVEKEIQQKKISTYERKLGEEPEQEDVLEAKVMELQEANNKLYKFAVNRILDMQ